MLAQRQLDQESDRVLIRVTERSTSGAVRECVSPGLSPDCFPTPLDNPKRKTFAINLHLQVAAPHGLTRQLRQPPGVTDNLQQTSDSASAFTKLAKDRMARRLLVLLVAFAGCVSAANPDTYFLFVRCESLIVITTCYACCVIC